MDGCGRCLKGSLICFNVVTFVVGVAGVCVGLWVWSARSFATPLLTNNLYAGCVLVLAVTGAGAALLAALGCCAAAKEVKCLLLTYYILVFIVFVVTLVGGILSFVFREKIYSSLDRQLYAALPIYGVQHEYTYAWDETQSKLECCGVRSYKDWNDNVPDTCCKEIYPGQRLDCKSSPNPTTMYMEGCVYRTTELLRKNAYWVGTNAILLSLILLLGLIFACGLFVKIE